MQVAREINGTFETQLGVLEHRLATLDYLDSRPSPVCYIEQTFEPKRPCSAGCDSASSFQRAIQATSYLCITELENVPHDGRGWC